MGRLSPLSPFGRDGRASASEGKGVGLGEGEGEGCCRRMVSMGLEPLTSILSPCEGERRSALSKLPRNRECFRHKLLSL